MRLLAFVAFLLAKAAFADAITGTGSFFGMPSTASLVATQTPYTGNPVSVLASPFWNNPSEDVGSDGHNANVGDVLAGLATNTNVTAQVAGTYYASSGGLDPVNNVGATTVNGYTSESTPLAFNFLSNATAYNVSLLFADSNLNRGTSPGSTVFGYYIGTGVGSLALHPLDGGVSNDVSGTPLTLGTNDTFGAAGMAYGFYATVCYQVVGSVCMQSVTYTTGAGNYTNNIPGGSSFLGALGYNHFALIELSSGATILALEDSPWGPGALNDLEGRGDFNDVVVELNPVPEPRSFWVTMVGVGFLVMNAARRRKIKL